MGAALLGVGRAAAGGIIGGKLSQVDPATATVRAGRFIYIAGIGYIAGIWYWGWRNERVQPGTGSFPIPGLYTGRKISDGAPDAGAPDDIAVGGTQYAGTPAQESPHGGGNRSGATLPPARGGGLTGNATLLVRLGHTGQDAFSLTVNEHPSFGGVHPVHVSNSLHYKGRAFDASAPMTREGIARMDAFAAYLAANYTAQITQLIWNGPNPVFILNGKRVDASVYADSLATHKNHVHVGI